MRLALRYLEAYRVPVTEYTNQTRVDPKSRKNLPTRKEREDTSDDPQEKKERRERPKPLPSGHPKGRDRVVPQAFYNAPKGERLYKPTENVGVDGEQYGNPVKEDYGYPRRRHFGGLDSPFPKKRQQNQGGEAKRYYQKRYLEDKERIKRDMKMRYKRTKHQVKKKIDLQYRESHPDRYKRRGEGYRSNADRAQDYRDEKKRERGAADLFTYDTEGVKTDPTQETPRADRSYPRDDLPAQTLDVSPAKGQTGPFRAQPSMNYDRGELADRHKHNRTAALRISDIDRSLSKAVRERSMSYTPSLIKKDGNQYRFKTGKWEQFLRFSGRETNVLSKKLASMRCTCPFYQWQGPEHWAMEGTYQLGPLQGTAAYPGIRDPDGIHPVCKHLAAVFRYIRKGESAVMRLAARHLEERT